MKYENSQGTAYSATKDHNLVGRLVRVKHTDFMFIVRSIVTTPNGLLATVTSDERSEAYAVKNLTFPTPEETATAIMLHPSWKGAATK